MGYFTGGASLPAVRFRAAAAVGTMKSSGLCYNRRPRDGMLSPTVGETSADEKGPFSQTMETQALDSGPAPGTDHQEVEWQFDALDARPVARWLQARSDGPSDGMSLSPSGEKRISDTYLDTEDWRVYRAGYALRIREKAGALEATMKLLSPAGDGEALRRRREISESLKAGDSSSTLSKSGGPVGERVKALAGHKSLKPLFEVRTRRGTYEVALGEDATGEVALDETEIPVEGGAPVALRRVEVEVTDGAPASFEPFVEELRRGCGLAPATASKFEAGLFALGLSPPEAPEFGPTEISFSLPVGEVAYAVMREQFEVFLKHEPGTRIGEDPEELHDMRVASRRMRAAMKVFEAALPVRSKKLRADLKWIAGILGEVRDLDVQLEELEGWISEVIPDDREPLGELRGVLEGRRERARKAMLRVLDSRRYERFVEACGAFLKRGPSRRSKEARRPVLAVGPEVLRRYYRKVRKAGDGISEDSSAVEYHELRKKGKRLRYALEFLSKVYGKPARDLRGALKSLQDVLGDHQDAEVAIAHLRELVPEKGRRRALSPRTVFVMGTVAHRYEVRIGELRGLFPDTYSEIKGKRWKRLKKKMDEARPDDGTA